MGYEGKDIPAETVVGNEESVKDTPKISKSTPPLKDIGCAGTSRILEVPLKVPVI